MVGPSELLSSILGSMLVLGLVQRVPVMYSYLPNGDVNAVLGIESVVSPMWWYPALKSKVEKYFAPLRCEKYLQPWALATQISL